MKKFLLLLIITTVIGQANGQHPFRAIIRDLQTRQIIPEVNLTIKSIHLVSAGDHNGYIQIQNIPAGEQTISFSHAGYETKSISLRFPLANNDTLNIFLDALSTEMEEVIIRSTRTSRTIRNSPTRVEIIDGEELDEKNNMRPANVSMLLHESTGIQVQQTSATSGNSNIRVQGLDGRYTQILKDGFSNYGNFAGGLSILEIPPLDLRQVEVIKGPASTLYGAGAIAGVINFISKNPGEKPVREFVFNQSHVGQTNLGGFISQKINKIGFTMLASVNFQRPYDVDSDDFSELPRNNNFTIHPGIYFYPDKTSTIHISHSYTQSKITGGDMLFIQGKIDPGHTYFERNTSIRNSTIIEWNKKLNKGQLSLKQSINSYQRQIAIPSHEFGGKSRGYFTDISWLSIRGRHTMIVGLNLMRDHFRHDSAGIQNNRSLVAGTYFQDTWDLSDVFKIESGIRIDEAFYSDPDEKNNRLFILPRVSILYKATSKISTRISGGAGYKLPSIFTEEAEVRQFRGVEPLKNVNPEKSAGATADINYRSQLGKDWNLSFNQLFFYTQIERPIILSERNPGEYFFENASGPIASSGFETNLKLIFRENLKLFAGYTFTEAKAKYKSPQSLLPLMPKSKLNLVLMFEKEDNFKLGLESYFTGRQFLGNGNPTPSFYEFGFMAQKTLGTISFFINLENFTDERQGKHKSIVNPPHEAPVFDEIWMHTEGIIVNGGIKLRL